MLSERLCLRLTSVATSGSSVFILERSSALTQFWTAQSVVLLSNSFEIIYCLKNTWIATITSLYDKPLVGVEGLDYYKEVDHVVDPPKRLECTVVALVVNTCTCDPFCGLRPTIRLWNNLLGVFLFISVCFLYAICYNFSF